MPELKRFFIAGTGTGVGKTFVTAALAWQLRQAGKRVLALKPVISGFDETTPEQSDTGVLLAAQGLEPNPQNVNLVSPWRLKAPLSPDMAAQREGKTIHSHDVKAFCMQDFDHPDCLLIESAGGIMSPVTKGRTMLDWAETLGYPAVLVAGTYLGSISHTLTALTALRARALSIRAVVVSASADAPVSPEETIASLRRHADTRFFALPRLPAQDAWKKAPNILSLLT
jgi:dethiobiotin synthetase